MAVSTLVSSSVALISDLGKTAAGKDITKKVALGQLVPTAADQDVYDVATAVGKLLKYPIREIQKVNNSIVTNA